MKVSWKERVTTIALAVTVGCLTAASIITLWWFLLFVEPLR